MAVGVSGFLNNLKEVLLSKQKDRATFCVGQYQINILQDMSWAFKDGQYYEINVEHWLKQVLCKLEKPIFYDVGSNYGYYSVILSQLTKTTYAFEPVAETFIVLKKNIKKNRIKNIIQFPFALSDKEESISINIYSSSGNNSMFKRNIPSDHPTKHIGKSNIRTKTIDSLVFSENNRIEKPDLIKIDVEGAELHVLKGAIKTIVKYKPVLLVEYSETTSIDAGYICKDIFDFIKAYDYIIYGLPEDATDLSLITINNDIQIPISNILAIPKYIKLIL